MASKNTPDQPDRIDPEAPTQQLSADGSAPAQAPPAAPASPAASAAAAPAPAPAAAPAAGVPGDAADRTAARRSRLAWVSSPRVAAATVITVLALAGLGGAFALGRATAGHDHGPRGVMVQMGVPGGQGFDERGFGRRFGGEMAPGLRGELLPAPREGQDEQTSPTPAPSDSTEG